MRVFEMTVIEQDLYDRQLARALNLHVCSESIGAKVVASSRQFNRRFCTASINALNNFRSDLSELGQKLVSAGRKINALLFLPSDMVIDGRGRFAPVADSLDFAPILIQPSINFAPPSEPVAMVIDESIKMSRQASALRADLAKQLQWFQKYGRDGLLVSAKTSNFPDKSRRHLSLVTEQSSLAA